MTDGGDWRVPDHWPRVLLALFMALSIIGATVAFVGVIVA